MTQIEERIYKVLNECERDLDFHAGLWWNSRDEYFKQFNPQTIDEIAMDMAKRGLIETNGRGFRTINKKSRTLIEKIHLKIWWGENLK